MPAATTENSRQRYSHDLAEYTLRQFKLAFKEAERRGLPKSIQETRDLLKNKSNRNGAEVHQRQAKSTVKV
ncbi:hypothetical protein FIBSPDRAFT_943208 [Athelia psychrophila]|uniref:Uncharacterized protein n=1 Tax=Athelia psychrophila TaxID=1759441 RepID=A0A166W528_9AGAM|nr:hypothetical protein FIBSPDRAFT_943208 [Fibularhizoctonia sp. CBS 109695]